MFLTDIWYLYLYQPLVNALIWIYSNVAGQNLGWTVVWLTVFLRLLLLPLTVVSERNVLKNELAEKEAWGAAKIFKNDPVAQKDEFRRVMKKHHISPWAKVLTLLIQVLVLVLLYQVFMRGITGDKIVKILYPNVDYPGKMEKMFYGFDVGAVHDIFWAGVVGFYVLASIIIEKRRNGWEKSEMAYVIIFPLFTFSALWFLPMVKSLFILTSMVFSDIITLLRKLFFPIKKA